MSSESHNIKKEVKKYWFIFGALIVLSVLTVGVSYIPFGVVLGVTVALIIATVKGSLVASCFMHLSHEQKLIYGILLLTVFFFLSMIILLICAHHDPLVGTENFNKQQPFAPGTKGDDAHKVKGHH